MTRNMNHAESMYSRRETGWKRTASTLGCLLLLALSIVSLKGIAVTRATGQAVSIVDAATGIGDFDLNSSQYGIGDLLLLNITIAEAINIYTWQVVIGWNSSLLSFVSIILPSDNIFAGRNAIVPPPLPRSGSVLMGAAIGPGQETFNGTGTVAQLTLMIKKVPELGQTLKTDIRFQQIGMDTFLLESIELNDVTEEYSWNDAHYQNFGDVEPVSFHDIAITKIAPTNTKVNVSSILNVSVTVANTGTYSETFAVGVYANMTGIAESQSVIDLIVGASLTLTFAWNTSNRSPGVYALMATAEVPEDASPSDNTLEFGIIYIIDAYTETAKIAADPLVLRSTAIGQNFVVNINVSDVVDLFTWQVGLAVNASSLKCTGVYNGGFLSGSIVFANATYLNETLGNVHLVGACLFGSVQGVSGSGQLAHLSFASLDTGVFTIHLTDLVLLDAQMEDIPFEAVENINLDIEGKGFDVIVTNNLTGSMNQPASSGIFNTSFNLSEKRFSFDALATKDWYCQVEIPKELLNCNDSSQWTVKVDGSTEAYSATEGASYTTLKFVHNEGYHRVEIIGTTAFGDNLPGPVPGPSGSLGPAPLYVAIAASVCLLALAGALVDLRKTRKFFIGFRARPVYRRALCLC